ncbi:MAG: TIGR03086 family protein [Actinomycetia bacterium]|nr:TIGR03086 family protein [Actinomycetes bacterium]MCP4958873.1 TIGR03086 family protein [Actinomycetes bacterium]
MSPIETLEAGLGQFRAAITNVDDVGWDTPTNCEPWSARQLASHALNSQLLWVGVLTGRELVSIGAVMKAEPFEGDLMVKADEVIAIAREAWHADGVLEAIHQTPFGELPGSVAINFPTIDSFAHSWDLSSSVGEGLDFADEVLPALEAIIAMASNEATRSMGLFAEPTDPPLDANATERLMASAGRTIRRA